MEISDEYRKKFDRGVKYLDKNPEKALALFKDFNNVYECKEGYINIAAAYKKLGYIKDSITTLEKGRNPLVPFSNGTFAKDSDIMLNNLGLLAHTLQDNDKAIEYYKKALEINPKNVDAIWNMSISRLQNYCSDKPENLRECWKQYGYRFNKENAPRLRNIKPGLKMWNKIDRINCLIVLAEQGFGDSLMFGRYLSELRQYTNELWIQCDPSLNYVFDEYNVCNDTADSPATHAIPVGSLGQILDYIPNGEWLAGKRVIKEHSGFRIGCIWKGNPDHVNDIYRSTTSFHFKKLAKYGELYSIGPASGPEKGFKHLENKDWKDTIESLGELDLVISVDTSIVHLCGSLGMPCWVLLPNCETDFRWGDKSMGFKNVWYPSVTVVRNCGDWPSTFKKVEEMLKEVW